MGFLDRAKGLADQAMAKVVEAVGIHRRAEGDYSDARRYAHGASRYLNDRINHLRAFNKAEL